MACAETSPVATLPWKGLALCPAGWLCNRPEGICAASSPGAKIGPKTANPSSRAQAQRRFVIQLTFSDKINVFYSQQSTSANQWLAHNGCTEWASGFLLDCIEDGAESAEPRYNCTDSWSKKEIPLK
jgi:hypothetical protein